MFLNTIFKIIVIYNYQYYKFYWLLMRIFSNCIHFSNFMRDIFNSNYALHFRYGDIEAVIPT